MSAAVPALLDAPLPLDWTEYRTDKGQAYYYNERTAEVTWSHPHRPPPPLASQRKASLDAPPPTSRLFPQSFGGDAEEEPSGEAASSEDDNAFSVASGDEGGVALQGVGVRGEKGQGLVSPTRLAAGFACSADQDVVRFAVRARHKLRNKHREMCVCLRLQRVVVRMRKSNVAKMFATGDVTSISRSPGSSAMILTVRGSNGRCKEKHLTFETPRQAAAFHQAITCLNACGPQLVAAFDDLDADGQGWITPPNLEAALTREGISLKGRTLESFFAALHTSANQRCRNAAAAQGATLGAVFENFAHLPVHSTADLLRGWSEKASALADFEFGSPRATPVGQGRGAPRGGAHASPLLLGGEQLQNVVDQVRLVLGSGPGAPGPAAVPMLGSLFLTNYRLVFWPAPLEPYRAPPGSLDAAVYRATRRDRPVAMRQLSFPHGCLARADAVPYDPRVVCLACKDARAATLHFEANATFVASFLTVIRAAAFPGVAGLFAYRYRLEVPPSGRDGWDLFNPAKEFVRQGLLEQGEITSARWRLYSDNYALCDTYPSAYVLPRLLSETEIVSAAAYRSRQRLPVVTYRHRRTGAVLARSSQPLAGIGGHTNDADKKLLELLRVRGDPDDPREAARPRSFCIVDARKPLATVGNRIQGKGVESPASYHHTSVHFCHIENIHHMRGSLAALQEVLQPADQEDSGDDDRFLSRLEATGWPRHCQAVLRAAVFLAEQLDTEGASVLVHCSDGWDRTAQLCSAAQVLLDPFFRTLEGFAVLVEKDWPGFGHKFQQRCGHGEDDASSEERSPIFLQWLEVIHIVRAQVPDAFEFDDRLLVFLADHCFSGLFGSFLGNSEKERRLDLQAPTATVSIWTYVLSCAEAFRNRSYQSFDGALWPSVSLRRAQLWHRYFCRWDPALHPRPPARDLWLEDYGTGILDGAHLEGSDA